MPGILTNYLRAKDYRSSPEFKSIIKKFNLKPFYEMGDAKTPDYIVYNSDYDEVKKALTNAKIPHSFSSVYGYSYRLSIIGNSRDIKEDQSITSADTSLKQVAAPFKKISWEKGTRNVDVGGGKYNLAVEYLKENGVEGHVYDPYNRPDEHNKQVLAMAPFDSATCFNVLNVIPEEENQLKTLNLLKNLVKTGGNIYISVYEGDKSGVGKPSVKGFQQNKKMTDYLPLISKIFPNVVKKSGYFLATN